MRLKIKIPPKNYDPFVIENKRSSFWEKTSAYSKVKKNREGGKPFFFSDMPQKIGTGFNLELARSMVIKDVLIRYKRLNGFEVRDQPGFDMHGLPVEIKIAEATSLESKTDIENYGIGEFTEACKEYADTHYKKRIEEMKSLGIWMDWSQSFFTNDGFYTESIWWTLKKAQKSGLFSRQKAVLPWCPKCQTVVGESDIIFKEVTDPSVYLKFPIKGRRDEYVVTWTTEPWTITGNLAIAVNPDMKYARVNIRRSGRKETIIVLEDRLEELANVAGIEAYEILETLIGEDLKGLEYFHPMMADIKFQKTATGQWVHKIITSEFVRNEKTGAVHISPGLGSSDFKIGHRYDLPSFCPIDEKGIFTTAVGMKYAGKTIRETEQIIVRELDGMRFVLHAEEILHKSGHCRYCNSPLIHRRSSQWMLKTSDLKDKMVRSINHISWLPDKHHKEKTYERNGTPLGVQKTDDWCISRQRYWGTPIPVWECLTDICGHTEFVGSLKELSKAHGYKKDMDLHRPAIDDISIICPKCNGLMKRVSDVIDRGYDSSISSWGQLTYPRKKKLFKKWWPATLVSESHAETRAWYYDQLKSSMLVFGKIPYKTALVQGRVLNSDGLAFADLEDADNADPNEIIKEFGADSLRFFLLGKQPLWNDLKYDPVSLKASKYGLNVLWNIYQFATRHASMTAIDPANIDLEDVIAYMEPEDKWLLSRVETMADDVRKHMEKHDVQPATRRIEEFILEDISRWYIKIVRKRTKLDDSSKEKIALCKTLHEVLLRTALVASPFVPFIAEEIYQNLDGRLLSVHMSDWPKTDNKRIDKELETTMDHVKAVVKAASKARQRNNLKLRWPVKNLVVEFSKAEVSDSIRDFETLVRRLLNAKNMEFVPPGEEWEGKELAVLPNPDIIGKAYKAWESKIAMMLKIRPAKEIRDKIEEGDYYLGIEGQKIEIRPEMVAFSLTLPDNFISADFEGGVIYINIEIDEELEAEGYTNDIIRRVQDMRKDMELDIEEYIKMNIVLPDELIDILLMGDWLDKIAEDTGSKQVELVETIEDEEFIVEWNIKGHEVTIGISSLYIKEAIDEFLRIPGVKKEAAMSLVEHDIYTEEEFLSAEREDILKIPGFSHSLIRKMKEYLETPIEERVGQEEELCPYCEGEIDPGAIECLRCGNRLISEEAIDVDFVGDISDMDDEFEDEDLEHIEVEEQEVEPEPEIRKVVRAGEGAAQPAFAEESYDEGLFEPEEELVISVSTTSLEEDPGLVEELTAEIEDMPVEPVGKEELSDDDVKTRKLDVLGDGNEREITTMASLLGIKPSMAKTLANEGYDSLESLREASEDDLKAIKGIGKVTARKILRRLSEDEGRMCSLCNAIVPKDAEECSRCGTKFTIKADGVEAAEEVSASEVDFVEDASARDDDLAEEAPVLDTLEQIEAELENNPRDPELLCLKAIKLKEEGRLDEAEETVLLGLKIKPGDGKLLTCKEEIEVELELKEESRAEKAKIVEEELPDADVVTPEVVDSKVKEEPVEEEQTEELKESFTYLIPEDRSKKSYKLFKNETERGRPGFCVTRNFPAKVKSVYDLDDVPILWLSNVGKVDSVRPKDLEKLSLSLEQFLSNEGGIILLDGIEYLITNNNFLTVLRLIQSLKDQVAINRSIFLISVNPSTLEKNQINLLEREVDQVLM